MKNLRLHPPDLQKLLLTNVDSPLRNPTLHAEGYRPFIIPEFASLVLPKEEGN